MGRETVQQIAQRRVARGSAWLDKFVPGWFKSVTIRDFDMESGCKCVLGQVFEPVNNAPSTRLERLAARLRRVLHSYDMGYDGYSDATPHVISRQFATACGFDSGSGSTSFDHDESIYAALQDEWLKVIRAHKADARVPVSA